MRLNGKTALVTGAATGIGAAAARALAAEGAAVLVTDLVGEGAAQVAESIRAAGGKAVSLEQDVTDEAGWVRAVTLAREHWGALHALVNNAGIAPTGDRIEALSLTDWRRTLAVNLDSVFLGTKHAILAMKDNGAAGGSVINISSVYGFVGTTGAPDYVASKGAVRLFSKAAALECAESGYPIRVNSVHPGFIETPMLAQGLSRMVERGLVPSVDTATEAIRALHPIGRLGLPTDIASAVVFLASDDSSFMTGAELVVDGGFTAR